MSGSKADILCSPHHGDRFVVFGQELNLYKIESLKEGATPKSQGTAISDDSCATLLCNNSDNQYAKCAAWYRGTNPDHLIAVGLANGKVVLSGFGRSSINDPKSLTGKEFVPRHARQCNALSWNPVETNLLAAGLDKYRNDTSVLIWDVERSWNDYLSSAERKQDPTNKPIYELGQSEPTYSLGWFHTTSRTLVTGISNKSMRVFDLREVTRPQSITYTKAVHGICVDLHSSYRLASFNETEISIWDTRNFDKPIFLKLFEQRPVLKMAWSPTREGVLGVLCRDTSVVKLYDIHQTSVGTDDIEPAVIERLVQPHPDQLTLASFDWHHKQENRILTVTPQGAIRDVLIYERIAVNWSPDIYLSWGCGQGIQHSNSVSLCREASEDISIKMKRRAQRGYGLDMERLRENAQRAGDDPQLRRVWAWLDYVRSLTQAEVKTRRKSSSNRYIGVKAVLKGEVPVASTGTGPGPGPVPQTPKSDLYMVPWQQTSEMPRHREMNSRKMYKSDLRAKALQLCGWSYDMLVLNQACDGYEADGEFERAATVALFNLQIRRAIQTLNRGASREATKEAGGRNLNIIAMALSGFTDDKNSLWREMCAQLSADLSHPYLRAMFDFLTTDSEHYTEILEENAGLEVIDKVAFACLYLPDTKLMECIERLTSDLVARGNLDGLLLTGLSREAVELLGNYVDATGDIQTASMIAIQGFPSPDIARNTQVHQWIDSYRELLDIWRMWHQRADLDVFRNSKDSQKQVNQQVFVSCNFCSKPVAYNMIAARNQHFMFGATTAHKPKITCCPGCRKPLPRCALCLVHMGTAAGVPFRQQNKSAKGGKTERVSKFEDWFTWCQSCRHGGHAEHVAIWFKEHSQCPVTGCTCKCTTLDGVGGVSTSPDQATTR